MTAIYVAAVVGFIAGYFCAALMMMAKGNPDEQ